MNAESVTVIRSLNNNAVLVSDGTQRYIVMRKGIGFQRRLGDEVAIRTDDEIFTTRLEGSAARIAQFVDEIPLEVFTVARRAITYARTVVGGGKDSQILLLAIADHLNQAVLRARQGIVIDYPTRWEVSQLYPSEMRLGQLALEVARKDLCPELPDSEATALAMHFVNASFSSGDLVKSAQMTDLINEVIGIIERLLGEQCVSDAMSVARFVTHLRYLYVRINDGRQLNDPVDHSQLGGNAQVRNAVKKVASCFEQMGSALSPAEIFYLQLHIERLHHDRLR